MDGPHRIASLLSSATEILYSVGAGRRVAAVSHECDHPAEARGKPAATRSRIDSQASSAAIDEQVRRLLASGEPLYEVDRDLLRDLAPDLIVTQAQCDVCAVRYADVVDLVRSEPALRHTQVVSLNPQSLDDIIADVARVGAAAGCADEAKIRAEQLQARVDAVRKITATIPEQRRPRVLCIEWIEPLMAAGNWTPQLLDLAGGINGLASAGRHSSYASWDEAARFAPETIIIAPCGFDLERSLREAQQLWLRDDWRRLAAVRQNRVFVLDGNAYLNRSGPRIVETLQILAHLLHPDLFAAPLLFGGATRPWAQLAAPNGSGAF